MNMLEAVANWYGCPYGLQKCIESKCKTYIWVDPRPEASKGKGPGTTGHRTVCSLLSDLDYQIMTKTKDGRVK